MLREGVWLEISLWLSFPKWGPDGTPASPAVKSGETSNRAVVPGRFIPMAGDLAHGDQLPGMGAGGAAPVAGMRRVDEERPDLGRVRLRVEPGLVPLGARVAAEQRPPPAPATACDDVAGGRLGDEVCPIAYEHRIDAEGSLECRFDLRRRVVRGPESVYRARDQLA